MTDHDLSENEKELFRTHMNGVTPLLRQKPKHQKDHTPQLPPPKRITPKQQLATPNVKKLSTYLSSSYYEKVYAGTVLSFTRKDIPSKRFRELKNGLIPWQAKLDLHGLRADPAQDALLIFLAKQINLNHRCVLIIHGKGGLGAEEASVLKSLVNHWLRQIPEVLAFHSAIPRDGGTGAVSVFLARS